ncbi:MAG: hypothetical protein IH945_07570 [Armatimonadetes bacterium]|nr:hypothetical protein [Armatimonadota bacterium]
MSEKSGLKAFFVIAGSLLVLRLMLAFLYVPKPLAVLLSVVNTAVFIGLPVYAVYRAAAHGWTGKAALAVLVPGVVLHVVGAVLVRTVLPDEGFSTVLVSALWQTGILMWTLGLGVLLSFVIKDKNMLIPVAIFLVGFDMFLVFNPDAPTAKFMRENPAVSQAVLATVPGARTAQPGQRPMGKVQDMAYIGPADLLFAATFFTLIFRFRMRSRQTLNWMVPVLIVYLAVILAFGDRYIGPLSLAMLPAMVPIGLTVLLVNRKEFKLQKQEVIGVVLVAAMAVALASYGVYRASNVESQPALPAEPSPSEPAPEDAAQEGSRQTAL